jgi:hypothetical protein
MELRLDPRRIAATLFASAVALLLLHVAGMYARYVLGHERLLGVIDTFNVNYENNVPTFFSALVLMSCAAVLAVVAHLPSEGARGRRYWGWLAVIFALLAFDEDAAIHELFIEPVKYFLPVSGPLHFAWVIPYGVGALVVGILYLRFVLALPDPTRWLAIASGTLYLGGAFVLEMVGGWYLSEVTGYVDFPYSLLVGAEEFLEMCGAILFLYTLLDYAAGRLGREAVAVRIGSA